MKFFCIKRENGAYEGMFIVEDAEKAREVAKNAGFQVDDDTVFEDITQEMTEGEKIARKGSIVDGS